MPENGNGKTGWMDARLLVEPPSSHGREGRDEE